MIVIRRKRAPLEPYSVVRPLGWLRYARRPYEAMMIRHAELLEAMTPERRAEFEGPDDVQDSANGGPTPLAQHDGANRQRIGEAPSPVGVEQR